MSCKAVYLVYDIRTFTVFTSWEIVIGRTPWNTILQAALLLIAQSCFVKPPAFWAFCWFRWFDELSSDETSAENFKRMGKSFKWGHNGVNWCKIIKILPRLRYTDRHLTSDSFSFLLGRLFSHFKFYPIKWVYLPRNMIYDVVYLFFWFFWFFLCVFSIYRDHCHSRLTFLDRFHKVSFGSLFGAKINFNSVNLVAPTCMSIVEANKYSVLCFTNRRNVIRCRAARFLREICSRHIRETGFRCICVGDSRWVSGALWCNVDWLW